MQQIIELKCIYLYIMRPIFHESAPWPVQSLSCDVVVVFVRSIQLPGSTSVCDGPSLIFLSRYFPIFLEGRRGSEISSKHLHSKTVKAMELKCLDNVHHSLCVTCHMSGVLFQVSGVRFHVLGVRCQVSGVTGDFSVIYLFH